MSLAQCASAAAAVFPAVTVQTTAGPLPLRDALLAIGGAESSWDTRAQGDRGLAGPSCNGFTSWGWLQIHSVHAAYLQAVTGSASACAWAAWLYDPVNCARAALAVYQSQGLGAWTTYQDGRWLAYLSQARQALAAPVTPPAGTGTGVAVSTGASVTPVNWPVVAAILGLAGAVAAVEVVEARRAAV